MEESDIQQLLAARRFDAAFGQIHAQFREKVFRLAFSMVRDATQAEDAAQDVFVRIWKGLPAYHGGASVSTWIYTITRNCCLTELTRRGRHPTVSLSAPEMETAGDDLGLPHAVAVESGAGMDVASLLAQLPENYRQVITLFYLEQKSYEDVAAMLALPLGTVKTFIFRAKKELVRLNARTELTPAASVPIRPKIVPLTNFTKLKTL